MKAKDLMKAAGLIGAGFVVGNLKGVIDCFKKIDKELETNDLTVDAVWWKPIGCKVTKVLIKKLETEGSAE